MQRGGFTTSEVANSEGLPDYFVSPYQVTPSTAQLPPLNQQIHTENMSPAPSKLVQKPKSSRQLEMQITALKKDGKSKDKRIEELNQQITTLTENGEEREERIEELLNAIRSKKGKKSRKGEQKGDVKTSIKDFVKAILFRTIKFAAPGEELTLATKKVWAGIKDKKRLDKGPDKLTEKDFIEIYDSVVSAALSDQRQYVQTRTSACIKGK